MEALYSALEGEISAFVKHVQWCRQGFDLHSLYHVLLLVLPRSPSGQVESWQHLQRLAQCWPGSASPDVASYVIFFHLREVLKYMVPNVTIALALRETDFWIGRVSSNLNTQFTVF